jgi:predicted nuclease with TOPRIM domain
MDNKKIADMLRMTTASMVELFNRVADHIEQLEHRVEELEKKIEEQDDSAV